MSHFLRFTGTFVVAFSLVAAIEAAPPWVSLVPFKKVKAEPQQDFSLEKKNGPWMILCMSFSGENAEMQAKQLAHELRKTHKVEAFVHRQEYDFTGTTEGIGLNARGAPKKMRYLNGTQEEEYAVLVGNFSGVEDPEAEKMINKLRYLQPKCLMAAGDEKGDPTNPNDLRKYFQSISKNQEKKRRGPLGKSFVTRNPLIPADEFAKQTLDPFVEDLNRGISHSLLTNSAKYTVQVATFRGSASWNEKEFNETTQKRTVSKIDEAAMNADKMTAELRRQGVEAFQFHDRHESIVTVGRFNEFGEKGPDGRIELPPEIARVIKAYEADKVVGPDLSGKIPAGQVGLVPKSLAGIPYDVSPRLILVPKKSIADMYRHTGLQK